MACGFPALHSPYMAATTVTSRGFQAYPAGTSLPLAFGLGTYQIAASGKVAPVVAPACGELPPGLQFEGQGIQVKLPTPTVAVTVQVGASRRQPVAVVGLDRTGQRIDQRVIPGDGALYTATLVGPDLAALQLVAGGDGGRLVQICGASSTMQTILEDYFDPWAHPIGLLPYIEAARRLFADYYLRPQEAILQGRLGSSGGIISLQGHRMASALRRPCLGYDGFYTHEGIERERDCLSPNWRVIRNIAMTLPLTVAAPTLLARVARGAGVAVAEIAQHEWVMKKAIAALVEMGFSSKIVAAAIPYLTADAELAAAWLICAGALG